MKKTLITLILGITLLSILSASTAPEKPSIDRIWDYCQEHYPDMTYDYYLDVFTETDEYEELYNTLIY